jgi:hypothetical protein
MSFDATQDISSVWQEIRQWPSGQRLALATRILESLERESGTTVAPADRQHALKNLIGIWKTENPPSDEQVERIVEEERLRKYG